MLTEPLGRTGANARPRRAQSAGSNRHRGWPRRVRRAQLDLSAAGFCRAGSGGTGTGLGRIARGAEETGHDVGNRADRDRQRRDLRRLLFRRPPGAGDLLHHERAVGILGADRAGEPDLANAEGRCGICPRYRRKLADHRLCSAARLVCCLDACRGSGHSSRR